MAFQIIRNDITKVTADAIVNTANPDPVIGGGTDSAIYRAAGEKELLSERKKIGAIKPGDVKFTPAFQLHAGYILHTVGPVWEGGNAGEFEILHSCYKNSLNLAKELRCESIAFPLISTGSYGFPRADALQIAISEIREFLEKNDMEVILVVFDRESFVLSGTAFDGVDAFVDGNYVEERLDEEYAYSGHMQNRRDDSPVDTEDTERIRENRSFGRFFHALGAPLEKNSAGPRLKPGRKSAMKEEAFMEESVEEPSEALDECEASAPLEELDECETSAPVEAFSKICADALPPAPEPERPVAKAAPEEMPAAMAKQPLTGATPRSLDDVISQVGETWQESLLRLIDEKGYTDTEVYKRANVDRKLFSKIRSNKYYQPKKATAVAFALALNLNLDETKDLLGRAGYAFSPGSRFDLIIEYFIEHEVYDFYTINLALFDHDQPLLGA